MLDAIRKAIEEISGPFTDARIHVCRLEATQFDGKRCQLAGAVLDADTAAVVLLDLAARFPGITFDTSRVRILRSSDPAQLVVAANLTGLHAQPSFLAELISQMVNGRQVEVLEERDRWVFVRQPDGYLGWTYRPYLAGGPAPAPTHLVATPITLLWAAPSLTAPLIGRVLSGTSAHIEAEARGWGRLDLAGGGEGWVQTADLRAVSSLPADTLSRRHQIVQDAAALVGVPYLWGGTSALGIDCSGFVGLAHRLSGVELPRDADMQFAAGRVADPPFLPGDLLFFSGEGTRKITHVALSLGGWRILHSSRARNGVYEDDVQQVEHLRASFAGTRSFL